MKKHCTTTFAAIRNVDAKGAAAIFALAYAAGFVGSLAALGIAAAFLGGLYLSTRRETVAMPASRALAPIAVPPAVQHPIVQALSRSGLIVQKLELRQPAAPRRAPKASVNGKAPVTI